MREKAVVLFLCTGNSARSQMAEALLREFGGDAFDAYSAGTRPAVIHELTSRVMQERGIPIRGQTSKGVEQYLGRLSVRHLIIVCEAAEQQCPRIWPGTLTRDFWPFPDPARSPGSEEERLQSFRDVRDSIEARIKEWLNDN